LPCADHPPSATGAQLPKRRGKRYALICAHEITLRTLWPESVRKRIRYCIWCVLRPLPNSLMGNFGEKCNSGVLKDTLVCLLTC